MPRKRLLVLDRPVDGARNPAWHRGPASRATFFIVGPQPPPTHGVAMINSQIAASLGSHGPVFVADTSPQSLHRSWSYHLKKFCRVLAACFHILVHRGRANVVYLSIDGGGGAIYNCLVAAIARLARARLFLHHHSFGYIDRRSPIISLLNRCSGRTSCNIFLCQKMASRYRDIYGQAGRDLVVGNAWSIAAPVEPRPDQARGRFTIGLLSNLTAEKGVFEFIKVARRCHAAGLPVRAILAGPCPQADCAAAIERAGVELGDSFEYWGPVFGARKQAFFDATTLFVFPTNYEHEAQPLVLLEALSFGCGVVSKAKGCIGEDFANTGCVTVLSSSYFIEGTLERISTLLRSPGAAAQVAADARRAFVRLKNDAELQLAHLFDRMGACTGTATEC